MFKILSGIFVLFFGLPLCANCVADQVSLDIVQPSSKTTESKIVVFVQNKEYSSLSLSGDLSNQKNKAKIEEWFDSVLKEACQ